MPVAERGTVREFAIVHCIHIWVGKDRWSDVGKMDAAKAAILDTVQLPLLHLGLLVSGLSSVLWSAAVRTTRFALRTSLIHHANDRNMTASSTHVINPLVICIAHKHDLNNDWAVCKRSVCLLVCPSVNMSFRRPVDRHANSPCIGFPGDLHWSKVWVSVDLPGSCTLSGASVTLCCTCYLFGITTGEMLLAIGCGSETCTQSSGCQGS